MFKIELRLYIKFPGRHFCDTMSSSDWLTGRLFNTGMAENIFIKRHPSLYWNSEICISSNVHWHLLALISTVKFATTFYVGHGEVWVKCRRHFKSYGNML